MEFTTLKKRGLTTLLYGALSVAAVIGFASNKVSAYEATSGDWTFSLHGNVNVHAVYSSCDDNPATITAGVFLCGGDDATVIMNGYLPTSFQFGVRTVQEGVTITGNLAYEPGTTSNNAFNVGDDANGLRVWMTLGTEDWGTLKIGRDFGVFALDVVFADISLLGTGAHALIKNPINTSLAAAGYGYIFSDRITQITYKLPTDDRLDIQVGIFQPLNTSNFGGAASLNNLETGSELPGLFGKFRINFQNDAVTGAISTSGLAQTMNNTAANVNYTAHIVDVFAQIAFPAARNLTFNGYYFSAKGVGHTGLFIDAIDLAGNPRDSSGYLLQASINATDKVKLAVNYGVTELDRNAIDPLTLLEKNEKVTGGIYYNVLPSVTLVGEYSRFSAENHAGGKTENDAASAGAVLFF